jgi:hypothetical protein
VTEMGVCISGLSACTKDQAERVLSPVDIDLDDSSVSTETTASWDSDDERLAEAECLATVHEILEEMVLLCFKVSEEKAKLNYTTLDFARDAAEQALIDYNREEEEALIAEAEALKELREYEEALKQMEKERAEMEEAERAAEKELLEAEEAERIAEKERLEAEEAEAAAAKV